MRIIDFVEEKRYIHIRERLESSRSSGGYWWFEPECFGLNSSPYNPLFEVLSRKFYYLRILPELKNELTSIDVGLDLPIITPRTRETEVLKFIEKIEVGILWIGWCYIDEKTIKNWQIHRLTKQYVFDLTQTIDLYQKRKELSQLIEDNTEWADEFSPQGHIKGKFGKFKELPGFKEQMEEYFTELITEKTVLFNHSIRLSERTYVLPVDNRRYIINLDWEQIDIKFLSYDHDSYYTTLYQNEVLLLDHPFPAGNGVVD